MAFLWVLMLIPCVINAEDPPPPPANETAKMARYVAHYCSWGSVATISSRELSKGYPFSNVISFSDGDTAATSTGTPYFYVTDLDVSQIDIKVTNKISLSMTLAERDFCSEKGYDPELPLCPRVIFTGQMETINNSSQEYDKAKSFLFKRHPSMANWHKYAPPEHQFYFTKMKLENIFLLANFGGVVHIPLKDYYAAPVIEKSEFSLFYSKIQDKKIEL